MITFPIAIVFFTLLYNTHATFSPLESQLLYDWAVNSTRNSGWNMTVDPCYWTGFTCGANVNGTWVESTYDPFNGSPAMKGSVTKIYIDQETQLGNMIYGEFPDLHLWSSMKSKGLAFTYLRALTFIRFRFGPSFPDTIDEYWTNYNDNITGYKEPFNVLFTSALPFPVGNGAPAAICPLPAQFLADAFAEDKRQPGRLDVGCSNYYILSVSPLSGVMTGGTTVTITVNGPLAYLNIQVGFGSFITDNFTTPVPIQYLFFFDYPWHDYIDPATGRPALAGIIYSQLTMITCVSPPHPPGPVVLSIWAGSGRNIENPFQMVLPRVNWGTYAKVFNYECPTGTSSSTQNGTLVCTPCHPGEWSPIFSAKCYQCAPGSYSTTSEAASCTLCMAGTFGNVSGASSPDSCYPCSAGYFNTIDGSQSCSPCDPGQAQSLTGQSTCDTCRAGWYSYGYGNTQCTKCTQGTFSSSKQMTGCNLCAIGYYNPIDGSSSCLRCPPGYTTSNLGSTSCDFICPSGFFKSSDSDRCVACAPGRYTNGTGPFAICQLCDIGYYTNSMNSTVCEVCPPGTNNTQQGSTSCAKNKVAAPPPAQNNIGLIIGIVLLVLAIILIIVAIIVVIKKKQEQKQKQNEIEEIRKIMKGISTGEEGGNYK